MHVDSTRQRAIALHSRHLTKSTRLKKVWQTSVSKVALSPGAERCLHLLHCFPITKKNFSAFHDLEGKEIRIQNSTSPSGTCSITRICPHRLKSGKKTNPKACSAPCMHAFLTCLSIFSTLRTQTDTRTHTWLLGSDSSASTSDRSLRCRPSFSRMAACA